jgi:hypothetical protein
MPAVPAGAATCPCSIWPSTATPATISVADPSAVELGVKFTPDTSGSITGVRFYKGPQNTGTHTGSLWTLGGQRLATLTFANETASGWQQASFGTPVNVTAGTTYIASYFTPVGNYSADGNYFANATDNTPLHAPSSASAGGNGVYAYGGGFPNSSFNATNYWVDVVFSSSVAVDTTPPTVTAVSPGSGSSTTVASTNITAGFSEAMTASTISTSTFEVRNAANALVAGAVTYNAGTNTATFDPTSDLAAGTYTATIKGGATDPRAKDASGNALAANYTWSFSVTAPTTLDQGPGGPILVVKNNANPYSKYYTEILRAEGMNEFASADVSALTSTLLNQYDVVVLGEVPLTSAQVTTLTTWVTAGGNLIAMRPDKKLTGLLGLTDQASTISDSYLLANTASAPGAGIVNQTIQYHGAADKYVLTSGATTVATLYSNATTATANPAVTMRSVGTSGGQAAAFTYDLAKSVIFTHQGNPAWAGDDRDGNGVTRPNDLYYGAKAGDVQPDYVDLNKVAIPQADEQQRLLGNMIEYMNKDRKVLPKFWYFPKGAKAVVAMVGDDHATSSGTKDAFNRLLANSPANCNNANWECLRATSLMYAQSPMSNDEALAYENQGFDIGSHVSTGCANWTPASLEAAFTSDLNDFRTKYFSLPAQSVNRIHCIAWDDWATAPKTELAHGMRLDVNYYYWPGSWVQDRPGMFTGNGIPMRFGDTDGSMIDVYQMPSHLVNESGQTFPANINTMLDRAQGPEGYYGVFGTHYDYTDGFDQQLMAAAVAHGVPVVSGQQVLDWTDARNKSSLTGTVWSGSNLNFTATVDAKAGTMMRAMLPSSSSKGTLSGIKKGTATVPFTTENIKGIQYAMFAATTGAYTATYAVDTTAPTVTSVAPAAAATGVSTSAPVTATFSENVDASTVSSSTFSLTDQFGILVPSTVTYDASTNTATLKPGTALGAGSAYTATVKGGATSPRVQDPSGNALATSKVWTFTTAGSTGGSAPPIGGTSTLICPCSLWPGNPVPANVEATDTATVELGVRFTSDTAGKITGVRFYKDAINTGAHTASLWDAAGNRLATVPVTGETASGWQTATFASPVSIAANTVYTASYLAPVGRYSYNSSYFASPLDSAPLHAPATSGGGNGVYQYGGGFPSSTWNATNYWVDPVFTP